jgi:hypothetical protein
MRTSLERNETLPAQSITRPGWESPLPARLIPSPSPKPAFLAHARLRRASPMTHYTVSAAIEALGSDAALISSGAMRLGIVVCTMTGGISYSRRFYEEVIQDPTTASPLVFPETVFNAPASHLSAYLNTPIVNYTLVGDAGTFLQGLAVAGQWLQDDVADGCLVIGAEELDWTAADALRLFERHTIYTAGAGALYLKAQNTPNTTVELAAVTDSFAAPRTSCRHEAAKKMRAQLPSGSKKELLCASEAGNSAWKDWPGAQMTPRTIFGEGFAALAAWQCVVACDSLQRCQYEAANVSLTGAGRQTIGARFVNSTFLS